MILAMVFLTVGVMYFPASAKTSDEGTRTVVTENLKVNLLPQRYVRYRGRIYRVRWRRTRRVRRIRYYRIRRVRYYRRYRRY
jgi:hypothetical protein